MMQEVPKADVVVVNPTHFAVALRYDERRMRAPVVVAKGVDEVAANIRAVALEHGVPLFEAPPLARALHRAVELAKAFAKFLLLALVAALVLWRQSGAMLNLSAQPAPAAIAHAASMAAFALLALAGTLALIAAVDVPWQLWRHTQALRMTREQIRDEMKETEGAPEIKGRIRRIQHERARRRMMLEVPRADVVVVNPTHFAVALRYDEQRMRAPIVVAKGQDLIAARIREIAAEHRVPIFEAPPLARALHRHVDLGGEIPAALYVAVAQVLTYLAQLRAARRDGATPPPPPAIADVSLDPGPPLH